MFKKPDFTQHPFLEEQDHFYHHSFFKDHSFGGEIGLENDEFEKTGRLQFFSDRSNGNNYGGKNFFRRGDIKIVLLKLLQEQPRHGYEIIRVLEERFKGFYSPSPGSVYPNLQMLEDQDLVDITKEGRKKVYQLTDKGQTYLDEHQNEDPFISRMEAFGNVDLNEMQALRAEIQHVFYEFFAVGRQVMENPEKKEQLQTLLKKTQQELSDITNDGEINKDEK